MTRDRIRDLAVRRFEEGVASSRFSTADDWDEWINEALLLLFPAGSTKVELTFPVAANEKTLRQPDRLARTEGMWWGSSRRVHLVSEEEVVAAQGQNWFSDTGTPDYAIPWPPAHWRFVPYPSAADNLTLVGWLFPAKLTADNQEPEFSEHLHMGLVWGACLKALAQDKDLQGSPVALKYFSDNLAQYQSLAKADRLDAPLVRGGRSYPFPLRPRLDWE